MNSIRNKVASYYDEKLEKFGLTSKGVDWNGPESHELRFEQLLGIVDASRDFSILDYGCGYGALIDFIKKKNWNCTYFGFDISEKMVNEGRKKYPEDRVQFESDLSGFNTSTFDYVIANGIFNVRLDEKDHDWEAYILSQLETIDKLSLKGFSFNMLTKYSDPAYMRDYLFYGDPCRYFDHCKMNFSRNVALLHDYDLYEFTILVRK